MATRPFDVFDDSFRVDIRLAEPDLEKLKQMRAQGEKAIENLAWRISDTVSLYRSSHITVFRSEFEGPFWIAYELSPGLMKVYAIAFDPDHLYPIEEAFLVWGPDQVHALRVPPATGEPVAWRQAPGARQAGPTGRFVLRALGDPDGCNTYELVRLCSRTSAFSNGVIGVASHVRQIDEAKAVAGAVSDAHACQYLASAVAVGAILFAVEHRATPIDESGGDALLRALRLNDGVADAGREHGIVYVRNSLDSGTDPGDP